MARNGKYCQHGNRSSKAVKELPQEGEIAEKGQNMAGRGTTQMNADRKEPDLSAFICVHRRAQNRFSDSAGNLSPTPFSCGFLLTYDRGSDWSFHKICRSIPRITGTSRAGISRRRTSRLTFSSVDTDRKSVV